jgi:hypothetical protein
MRSNIAFWERLRDSSSEQAEARPGLIEEVQKQLAHDRAMVATAEQEIAAAREALNDPSKPAPPEQTAKEVLRIMREAGWTKQDVYRARTLGAMSEEEFEARMASRRRRRRQR